MTIKTKRHWFLVLAIIAWWMALSSVFDYATYVAVVLFLALIELPQMWVEREERKELKIDDAVYTFSLNGSTPTALQFSAFELFFIRIAMRIVGRRLRKEEEKLILDGNPRGESLENLEPIWESDPRD